MLTNYDNEVVSAKAWNRLFAVDDWAESKRMAQVPQEQRPSLRESVRALREHERVMNSMAEWQPSAYSAGDPGFEIDDVMAAARDFLTAWQSRNYGVMARLLSPLMAEETRAKTAGELREDYSALSLESFEVFAVSHEAPAVAFVRGQVTVSGEVHRIRLSWTRGGPNGHSVAPIETGTWGLMHWSFESMRDHEELS